MKDILTLHNLESLSDQDQKILYEKDKNGRSIKIFTLRDVQVVGQSYPAIHLFCHTNKSYYRPIREEIMSLRGVTNQNIESPLTIKSIEKCPVFFWIYNTFNYYHAVVDSLPYLISFRYLKESIPELKLLIGCTNSKQHLPYRFVIEFLELLDILESDLIFVDNQTIYQTIFISSSFTHDNMSDVLPRQEIYELYRRLASQIDPNPSLPRKIYISRRSHKHGKYDNMGTDYTTRRRLVNEDELVDYLVSRGYVEIFTELLSTKEKINLFRGATHVVGPIGGGLCNVLFAQPETKLTAIVSPHFLEINGRFKYSFAGVDARYFYDTEHVETTYFKRYMRVRVKKTGLVGEISDVTNDSLRVIYSREVVAGWNAQESYEHLWVSPDEVEALDLGLNSAWKMDLNKFKELMDGWD